jgi:hypothetical protein
MNARGKRQQEELKWQRDQKNALIHGRFVSVRHEQTSNSN